MDFSDDSGFRSSTSPSALEKEKKEVKDEQPLDLLGSFGSGTSSTHRPIVGVGGGNLFEEDLMREFNQKASEFSTFLDESHPPSSGGASLGVDLLAASSASEKSSTDTSPNPSNLSTQAQFMEAIGGGSSGMSSGDFDLIGDFKTAGGDSKITEELMAAAREFGEGNSPTPLDLGFEQVHGQKKPQSFLGDQSVSPGQDFHYTQSEPAFGKESPKLPNEPCFKPSPEPPTFEDYTRRETMTFDQEVEPPKNLEKNLPPPIPKHAYEIRMKESPPPVPKHADEQYSSFKPEQSPPFIHASYDDRIDDEFDDDSLSRPLSHKLSDSLEVLKESPQKDFQMDESLMDLEELSSSKSISPNAHGSGGIPPEMLESTLFSQQPPASIHRVEEEEERFGFTHVSHDVKPTASIPPFANVKGINNFDDSSQLIDSMTSSMLMNTSLDDIQAPKFYESEDSSSSNKGKQDSTSSSIYDKTEAEPIKVSPIKIEKKKEEPKKKDDVGKSKPPAPPTRHTIQVIDNNDFQISAEVIQILNTFNPRMSHFFYSLFWFGWPLLRVWNMSVVVGGHNL
jgi:hypothetical protein